MEILLILKYIEIILSLIVLKHIQGMRIINIPIMKIEWLILTT